ncbi:MAG: oxidoreductase [Planctomycetota bacterium]
MPSREFTIRLHALIDSSFPKRCGHCGRVFENLDQYFRETRSLNRPGVPGQLFDDESTRLVVVSRNCACGSTLMGVFDDRRDQSEEGKRRRVEFDELLGLLVATGLEGDYCRAELRNAVRGDGTDILDRIRCIRSGKGDRRID